MFAGSIQRRSKRCISLLRKRNGTHRPKKGRPPNKSRVGHRPRRAGRTVRGSHRKEDTMLDETKIVPYEPEGPTALIAPWDPKSVAIWYTSDAEQAIVLIETETS